GPSELYFAGGSPLGLWLHQRRVHRRKPAVPVNSTRTYGPLWAMSEDQCYSVELAGIIDLICNPPVESGTRMVR
ncbi:MAG: hypothetical protein KGK12_06130, partial [Armatimonadetes bacterium]|nr:hypothetical protein [Armatimonadota bacterium]